jgi:hypothetical protein
VHHTIGAVDEATNRGSSGTKSNSNNCFHRKDGDTMSDEKHWMERQSDGFWGINRPGLSDGWLANASWQNGQDTMKKVFGPYNPGTSSPAQSSRSASVSHGFPKSYGIQSTYQAPRSAPLMSSSGFTRPLAGRTHHFDAPSSFGAMPSNVSPLAGRTIHIGRPPGSAAAPITTAIPVLQDSSAPYRKWFITIAICMMVSGAVGAIWGQYDQTSLSPESDQPHPVFVPPTTVQRPIEQQPTTVIVQQATDEPPVATASTPEEEVPTNDEVLEELRPSGFGIGPDELTPAGFVEAPSLRRARPNEGPLERIEKVPQ